MYEEFSPRGRAVCESTASIAFGLGHNYVGTEHLLLALLADEERAGGGPLLRRGVQSDAVRRETVSWLAHIVSDRDALRSIGVDVATPPRVVTLPLPLTARTYKVLHLAVGIAATEPVEPRHILQAVLEEDEGLAVIVLDRLGVDLDALRADVESSDS